MGGGYRNNTGHMTSGKTPNRAHLCTSRKQRLWRWTSIGHSVEWGMVNMDRDMCCGGSYCGRCIIIPGGPTGGGINPCMGGIMPGGLIPGCIIPGGPIPAMTGYIIPGGPMAMAIPISSLGLLESGSPTSAFPEEETATSTPASQAHTSSHHLDRP